MKTPGGASMERRKPPSIFVVRAPPLLTEKIGSSQVRPRRSVCCVLSCYMPWAWVGCGRGGLLLGHFLAGARGHSRE